MKLDLRQGDCVARMNEMPEGSVDAIVADPPYGIEFMGKKWDRLEGVDQSQNGMEEFHRRWLEAAYRVLKPGGVVKAFSASRTFHRLAAAMSKVGFQQIRAEAWIYSCLPTNHEVLTPNGWVHGNQIQVGDRIACWDRQSDEIVFHPVDDVVLQDYVGDMVQIANVNTHQILTPTHTVYHLQHYQWCGTEARSVPHNLLIPVSSYHKGSGSNSVDLTWENLFQLSLSQKFEIVESLLEGATPVQKVTVDGKDITIAWSVFLSKDVELLQTLFHLTGYTARYNARTMSLHVRRRTTIEVKGSVTVKCPTDQVWCVSVPTGSFMVRHGQHIFMTGNSGFPKSMNISKQIDKMKGAVREPKRVEFTPNSVMSMGGSNSRPWQEEALAKGYHELTGDKPVTDEAKLWDGWGTALKPAFEPVIIGVKPV